MGHPIQRFGVGGRGLLVLFLLGLLAATSLLVRSAEGSRAPLVLLALGADGRPGADVRAPEPDSLRREDGRPLVPLRLVVRNDGGAAVRPGSLDLLLPARFRLRVPVQDDRITMSLLPGQSVVRYRITGLPTIPPDTTRLLLPVDTLWVQVADPAIRCIVSADSVPEFEAAPAVNSADIAELSVYYAFRGGELEQRRGGRLSLRLDAARLAPAALPPLPVRPTVVHEPAVPWPSVDSLRLVATAWTACGPPEDPQPMATTLWRTAGGGRVFGLSMGGVARKYLYDLNADSVAELEVWDANSDGRFEAEREARIPLPSYLFPPPPAPRRLSADTLGPVRPDSLGRRAGAPGLATSAPGADSTAARRGAAVPPAAGDVTAPAQRPPAGQPETSPAPAPPTMPPADTQRPRPLPARADTQGAAPTPFPPPDTQAAPPADTLRVVRPPPRLLGQPADTTPRPDTTAAIFPTQRPERLDP